MLVVADLQRGDAPGLGRGRAAGRRWRRGHRRAAGAARRARRHSRRRRSPASSSRAGRVSARARRELRRRVGGRAQRARGASASRGGMAARPPGAPAPRRAWPRGRSPSRMAAEVARGEAVERQARQRAGHVRRALQAGAERAPRRGVGQQGGDGIVPGGGSAPARPAGRPSRAASCRRAGARSACGPRRRAGSRGAAAVAAQDLEAAARRGIHLQHAAGAARHRAARGAAARRCLLGRGHSRAPWRRRRPRPARKLPKPSSVATPRPPRARRAPSRGAMALDRAGDGRSAARGPGSRPARAGRSARAGPRAPGPRSRRRRSRRRARRRRAGPRRGQGQQPGRAGGVQQRLLGRRCRG